MTGPGGLKGAPTLVEHALGSTMMDVVGAEHGDSAMAMLGAVPREERSAEGDHGGDVLEAADPACDLRDQRDREPEQHSAPGDPHAGALPERPCGDEADLRGAARGRAEVAGPTRVWHAARTEFSVHFRDRFALESA